jgi:hypothetical protein
MGQKQERRPSASEGRKEVESYLNLKLLGRVVTYAIVVLIALGLAFLTGIVIWVLRRILGV